MRWRSTGRIWRASVVTALLFGPFASLDRSAAGGWRAGNDPNENSVGGNGDVEAQTRAFLDHYTATLEAGEDDAIRALFVDDERFAWFTDGLQSYASPEDVLIGMRHYAALRFTTELSQVQIVPLGASLASARSSFRTQLSIPGSEVHEFGGCITWLLEKDAVSGDWRVLLGHTSTPGKRPTQDADRR